MKRTSTLIVLIAFVTGALLTGCSDNSSTPPADAGKKAEKAAGEAAATNAPAAPAAPK